MPFPFDDYDRIAAECKAIVTQRDRIGRNDFLPFYQTRCHGSQDMVGECWQRISRIVGAEKTGQVATMRAELVDLVNEAIFALMFLDKEHANVPPQND